VDRFIDDTEAHQKALAFKRIIEQYDAPANAARFLTQTFGD
jgi:hypothetical protein